MGNHISKTTKKIDMTNFSTEYNTHSRDICITSCEITFYEQIESF